VRAPGCRGGAWRRGAWGHGTAPPAGVAGSRRTRNVHSHQSSGKNVLPQVEIHSLFLARGSKTIAADLHAWRGHKEKPTGINRWNLQRRRIVRVRQRVRITHGIVPRPKRERDGGTIFFFVHGNLREGHPRWPFGSHVSEFCFFRQLKVKSSIRAKIRMRRLRLVLDLIFLGDLQGRTFWPEDDKV